MERKNKSDFIQEETRTQEMLNKNTVVRENLKKKTRTKYNETFEYPFNFMFNKDKRLNRISPNLTFGNGKDTISYVIVVKGVIRTIKLWSLFETDKGLHFLLEINDLGIPKRYSDTCINIPYVRYSVRVETDRYDSYSIKDLDKELNILSKFCIKFGCRHDYDWISLDTDTDTEFVVTEFFADVQTACKIDKKIMKYYRTLVTSV